jgi:hypothetical protein
MSAKQKQTLKTLIEDLTGQPVPLPREIPDFAVDLLTRANTKGLGYSQFNELLLQLGYDRVSHSFFQYLVNQKTDYRIGASLKSLAQLRKGADEFRKVAVLFFGNIKFAFKQLSRDASFLKIHLARFTERREETFKARHEQIMSPNVIGGADTYLLGYLVAKELQEKLAKDPKNPELLAQEKKRQEIVEKGKRNQEGYLISDHMDVYIATSMRERHEFISVYETTRKIFQHDALKNLKLRWFDPTQAYCDDRIDKGLAEGLMLRRAKCTVYFAQESDTFGKDSELACTLAQGKPVIAYVPRPSKTAAQELVAQLADKEAQKPEVILRQIRACDPSAAWTDEEIQSWVGNPSTMPIDRGIDRLQKAIEKHFANRNDTLRNKHPLGVQINLQTGVANGVLVANTVDECARLIRALLLRKLEFVLTDGPKGESKYLYLREKITSSVFRVVTGDSFLTNAFWNFYLNPVEETYSSTADQEDFSRGKGDPYDLTKRNEPANRTLLQQWLSLEEKKAIS